ncbi:MAG: hypothetical protein Q9161_003785 [Pseudevernia consocians]
MEFVRVFVDEDLAWVVGVAYWYTYAATFATQIVAAASFTEYWGLAQVYQTVFFYFVAPFAILFINFAGTIGSEYINEGFTNNKDFASNPRTAGCYVLPIIAFAFLGVELVSVTAFEARDLRSLRFASQTVAYFVISIYLFCAIGEFLNVEWSDGALPQIYGGINQDSVKIGEPVHNSRAVIVVAALRAGYTRSAGLLNGCMIFSALSASNTSLYVASRTLYGMTRKINPWKWFRFLKFLGSVWHKTGVPMWALFFSFIAFYWLPFLQLHGGYAIADLLEIMSISASGGCLLVWASQCLAFIRYWAWLRKHKNYIARVYPEHDRNAETSQASTFLGGLQPALAIFGLIASLTIVLVFTTATWWSTPPTFRKIAVAYGAPVVLTAFFVVLKAVTRRGYVKLDNDVATLQRAIESLKQPKREQQTRERHKGSDIELTGPSGAEENMSNKKSPDSSHEGRAG